MELFPFTLPKSRICMETELYYRSSRPVQYNEQMGWITFSKGTKLAFDTYFNCFSYQKYLQYTSVHVLKVHLWLQGKVEIKLMKAELNGKIIQRTMLLSQTIQSENLKEIELLYDFKVQSGSGIFYIELIAMSKKVIFAGGCYTSPVLTQQLNDTKIAVVICTYKREVYIHNNLDHLNQMIFEQSLSEILNHLQIFIVDNGQTLLAREIETPHIRLFPNKNYGGSGGFTRGIMETLGHNDEFSHVLLMDDDILFESNVLVKTIRFIQILRKEHQDLVIGGSMLRLDLMNIQHEAGGRWNGLKILSGNHNIDLTEVLSLLQNELLPMPQYNAWWYCCLPLCLIDKNNLPLPFFIKVDDIEYGLRIIKKIMIMNGIGIWHEPFEKKQQPYLDYYDVRNKLVLNTLYEQKWLINKNLFLVCKYIGKHLLRGSGEMTIFPIMGCVDFLEGVNHFVTLDAEQWHQELNKKYIQLKNNKKRKWFYYWFFAGKHFFFLVVRICFFQKKLKNVYINEVNNIMNIDYWNSHLS